MKHPAFTIVAALAGVLSQCLPTGASQAEDSGRRCGPLPPGVAEMRARILVAAETGSLEDLAALGDEGSFTASYGGSETATFWRQLAAEGTDMREIARTLLDLGCSVSAADDTTYYSWPAAVDLPYAELTERERAVLAGLHGGNLESVYVDGPEIGYYVGWTLTIDETGDWIALVAGD